MSTSSASQQAGDSELATVVRELEALIEGASTPNWDGYGAQPARPGAVEEARTVLRILPRECLAPQPCVEPDGSVGLEWHVRPGWTYVLTVSGRGQIEYAGLFGDGETHGRERLGESLPPLVAEHLRRVASPE